jgi:hypothetical protein
MFDEAHNQLHEDSTSADHGGSPAGLIRQCLDLTEVSAPYFALADMSQDAMGLSAGIPVQVSPGFECGTIGAAEAGRHLAILGACAAALANPDATRHYYLAHMAHFSRYENSRVEPRTSRLRGRAQARFLDKRTALAYAELASVAGRPVGRLTVRYHVVPERAFARLHAHHRQEAVDAPAGNPYEARIPIRDVRIEQAVLTAATDTIEAHQCAGHFDAYPALPVAVTMQTLIDAACELMHHIIGRPPRKRYLVVDARVGADRLVFAGQHLEMRVAYLGREGADSHRFHCHARARGASAGNLVLTLKPVTM